MRQFTKRQLEIIRASVLLIAQGGIQKLTIKNIASQLSISEPALYRHFSCKLDILSAILDFFADNARSHLSSIASQKLTPIQKITEVITSHCDNFSTNPAMVVVIFSEEIFRQNDSLSVRVASIMGSHQKMVEECIKQGQAIGMIRDDVPNEHLCLFVLGSLRLLITQWRLANFGFDLVDRGQKLVASLKSVLQGENKANISGKATKVS